MYDADGFRVPFPFSPYPLQLHAMGAIRGGLLCGSVVVLESPTGTGKTQVLLNGVLSHLYEPVAGAAPHSPPPPLSHSPPSLSHSPPISPSSSLSSSSPSPFSSSLSAAGAGRKRRRVAAAADPFLVAPLFRSPSSASSQCASDEDKDKDKDKEEALEPLRKPKVYFASRTHTQLQQLTEELRRTVFASQTVRRRDGDAANSADSRSLRYVHVAGRQQLCLNAAIRAASGGSNSRLNELCLEAMAYENSQEGRRARRAKQETAIRDIEDGPGCAYCARERLKLMRDHAAIRPRSLAEMRSLGQRVGGCPYLTTRALLRGADVVLVPYGYLVSSEMRHALFAGTPTNLHATAVSEMQRDEWGKERRPNENKPAQLLPPDFSGDVIVVDEAHNVVDSCRNATMATVTAIDLSLMRRLFEGYLARYESRLLTRNKQRIREMVSFLDKLLMYLSRKENEMSEAKDGTVEVHALSSFIFDADVDMVNVYRFISFLDESRLLPKLHGLVAFLTAHEVKEEEENATRTKHHIKQKMKNEEEVVNLEYGGGTEERKVAEGESNTLSALLSHIQQQQQKQQQQQHSVRSVVAEALHRFDAFLRWYSRSDTHTRVLLRRTAAPVADGNSAQNRLHGVSLDLLQLEPGTHTLYPVLQQAGAAVFAGGTMKPLALTCDLILRNPSSDTKNETGTEKRIRFVEEGHIVPPSSIAVFTLSTGPSGARVELQHATRAHWSKHFDEVAAAVLNFSRIVPGGMIIFFTSYEVEDLFITAMQRNGFYDKINEVKRIFCEPSSGKKSAIQTQSSLSGKNTNSKSHSGVQSTSAVESMLADYADCVQQRGGAILLAVMGGKLSEGINFNDDLGRAVIVVGMPYANPSDVELQLHLRHISTTRLGDAPRGAPQNNAFDSPAQWGLFSDLCMRSVNQSIGRCIRHAADYAVVILFDPRYGEREDVRRRISAWLQPSLRVTKSFGECFRGVRDFFIERKNA